jgi:hypothetical protein
MHLKMHSVNAFFKCILKNGFKMNLNAFQKCKTFSQGNPK